MEEDIKDIEKRLNDTKNAFHKLGWEGQININLMLNDIENLIARNKELETKGKLIRNNYIPKSKVKEILNKLSNHNYKCNFDDVDFLQNIIIEIQELIED